jgi:hypothetical protein
MREGADEALAVVVHEEAGVAVAVGDVWASSFVA